MNNLNIRRTFTIIEDKFEEAGQLAPTPVRKVAVIAVLENPYASAGFVKDLSPLTKESVELGRHMGQMARQALGDYTAQGYGKGALVGLDGEQEHANALLTTVFANPIRDAIGGGEAWISSMQKVVSPGSTIDIPMNHKDDVYVRSHYDGMTITLQGTPMPDEIAIIFCLVSNGRINARVGGLTHEEVSGRNRSLGAKAAGA
ncbi:amino acid synthesis family protein [Rhizobium sp. R693]|uniref:amino acid synthesis family protein n=1 Tax=Rhizobium sp. R693 TaxID=1764276 RepID=UPI000B52FCB0|nr:amino acid synthesis family protein [Rhizobium sp. R693]OWV93606.1 hypothetical protein ATY79_27085 [Rhizobium sp. R693]